MTALEPVLRRTGGTWVGWPGADEADLPEVRDLLDGETRTRGYRLEPVGLTALERRDFYLGFSNEILWPLCHGVLTRCNFEGRYWDAYRRVNAKFAAAVDRVRDPGQLVWVHDYHLMAVAERLRERGCSQPIGYFHHIPFPSPDTFEHLPWAVEVVLSLLEFDLVGFQTERDRRNFVACLDALAVGARVVDGRRVRAPGGRQVRLGTFPISIDWSRFHDGAASPRAAELAREVRAGIRTERVLLGVDRLDYTKGIPQKLNGFERALERFTELRGRVSLVQLVVPSRETIPEYERMKAEIEGMVGRINGRFTQGGWVPILYRFGTWDRDELLAFYRASDAALVTSLRDGMNLVSKEFVAASVEGRGVLVLSSLAGSADELGEGAILVNPHDRDGLAEAVRLACSMPDGERRVRLERMQARVRSHDVHAWVRSYLDAARGASRAERRIRPQAPRALQPRTRPLLLPLSSAVAPDRKEMTG